MAFGAGTRQWVRGTLAKIAASSAVLGSGELLVDEAGGVYGGDGTTVISALKRLVRLDEAQQNLPVVAAATAAATLVGDRHTPVDVSAGTLTMTLPTPTRVGQQVRVEKADTSANVVTISGTLRGVTDTVTLRSTYEVRTFVAESTSSWRVASGNQPRAVISTTVTAVVALTQAQYDALATKDAATLYVVT